MAKSETGAPSRTEVALRERVKELKCLYNLSRPVETPGIALKTILQGAVELLPPTWHYPEFSAARIVWRGQTFESGDFSLTPWMQSAEIVVQGERVGSVAVCYRERDAAWGERPFLKEERELLDAVAQHLGWIIERHRAEAALRVKEAAMAGCINAIAMADLDGRLTYVNDAFVQLWGYDAPEEVLGRPVLEFWRAPDKAAQVVAALQHKGAWKGDLEAIHKIGAPFYVHLAASMITDREQQPVCMMASFVDVTERRRMEEALQASEARWRSLVTQAPDIIFTVDRTGRIQFINHPPAGLTVAQVLGTHVLDYVTPAYHETVSAAVQDVFRTGEPGYYEISARGPHDSVAWYATRLGPIKQDDQVTAVILITRDITVRKQTAAALQESEEKFRSLIQQSLDGIVLMDEEGTVIEWNQGQTRITGLTRDDVLGRPAWDVYFDVLPLAQKTPEIYARMEAGILQVFEGERDPELVRRREIRHVEGGRRVIQSITFPITTGECLRLGEIVRDVTELDEAEAALKRSHAELQQLAYAVSHDLQEPLRMVREFMRLLRQRYAGQLDGTAQEYIAYAVDGATRMQEMIEALLLYARVHTQGHKLAPTDCEALLAQVLSDLRFRIDDVGARVTHESLPTVMGDALQLGRVFQNLLSNALKFQPAGQCPRVHVSAAQRGEVWRFAVRDNGIGIAPQDMEHLFQVFGRLHDREKYTGIGIGLATCQRIIARHGGRIWAESTPGEGSTFYFTLPAVG